MDPKVTIGLCVKNAEKTVKEAIDSILGQDFPHELMEVIIVEDSSRDKTLPIVMESVSKTGIPVKICSFHEWKGLGFSRQVVVDEARGEYILWVDGDVTLPRNFVRKQVEFMEQNPCTGVAGNKIGYKEATLVATLENLFYYITGFYNCIYRTKTIRQIGGFDKNIKGACEDTDVYLRMKDTGFLLSKNQEAKLYHKYRETWKGLWDQYFRSGYGNHYISHKHNGGFRIIIPKFPLIFFLIGFEYSLKAYKATKQKKSFLMPLQFFFKSLAFWLGFIKGHVDGYGHQFKEANRSKRWLAAMT